MSSGSENCNDNHEVLRINARTTALNGITNNTALLSTLPPLPSSASMSSSVPSSSSGIKIVKTAALKASSIHPIIIEENQLNENNSNNNNNNNNLHSHENENSNDDGGGITENGYKFGNYENYFTKNLLINDFWKKNKILLTENIYENLCENCGYGVFDAKGKYCYFCEITLIGNLKNKQKHEYDEDKNNNHNDGNDVDDKEKQQQQQQIYEKCYFKQNEKLENYQETFQYQNIYENICDKCGKIYNTKECELCMKINLNNQNDCIEGNNTKIKTSKIKKSKILNGIVGTLKRVRSSKYDNNLGSTNVNSNTSNNCGSNKSNNNSNTNNSKLKKINIIHNVDGYDNVFRTQETFDLNHICKLKSFQSNSDQHIYGKLRTNENHSINNVNNNNNNNGDIKIEGNSFGNSNRINRSSSDNIQKIPINSIMLNENSKSDSTLNRMQSFIRLSPSVNDDGQSSVKENKIPFPQIRFKNQQKRRQQKHQQQQQQKVNFVIQEHVIEWMTSLRYQTHEYTYLLDDSICSTKSIPSRNFSCCGLFNEISLDTLHLFSSLSVQSLLSLTSGDSEVIEEEDQLTTLKSLFLNNNDCDYTQMIDDFKRNLMEKQRYKRKAIYLKIDEQQHNNDSTPRSLPTDGLNLALLHSNDSASRSSSDINCCRRYGFHENNNNDSDFVNDLLNAFDSFLKRDVNQNQNQNDIHNAEVLLDNNVIIEVTNNVESNNNSSRSVPINKTQIVPFKNNKIGILLNTDELVFIQNISLSDIIKNVYISSSLNRIIISYDRILKEFLRAINTEQFATCKFSQLLEIFQNLCANESLQQLKTSKQLKKINKYNFFVFNALLLLTSQSTLPLVLPTLPAIQSSPPNPLAPNSVSGHNSYMNTSVTVCGIQSKDEDDIYQPIWKFKTVGNPRESYGSEFDYYDITSVSGDSSRLNAEDHGEWETDDEFMFSTKTKDGSATAANSNSSDSECRSMTSTIISGSSKSLNSSGVGGVFGLIRNVCIIYSLTEPKIRAILYDYDVKKSGFISGQKLPVKVKNNNNNNNVKLGGGCVSTQVNQQQIQQMQIPFESSISIRECNENYRNTFIPDCVQAWKFMLLDTFYIDDEEDVYISEDEIQKIKQVENEVTITGATLQRFKSVSSDNLLDIPRDKKSLSERFRNKLQRGVLKLNRSPKAKKGKLFPKRSDSTSLYLEDGIKPKYPIFGATLNDVEKDNHYINVPKFVVDCIKFIETKDCIQCDGLYRASGNKIAIDDLKKRLSETFVYDCKFLMNQDVHTVTGLLKLFFRELKTPLIPNDTYHKLPNNLNDIDNLPIIKKLLQSIPNPSRSTLQYLVEHLTNVARYSSENRMPASNLAIIWGPCILFSVSTSPFDIARMNTLIKILIDNYDDIFADNERLIN